MNTYTYTYTYTRNYVSAHRMEKMASEVVRQRAR